MSWSSESKKRILLAVLSSCVGITLAECAARLVERAEGYRYYSPHKLGKTEYSLRAYRYSPEYGYEPIPGDGGANSLGLRGPEYPIEKKTDVTRILLVGDSLAESYAQYLREAFEKSGNRLGKVEIWNMGVGGYNIRQYGERLLRVGLKYDPDMILMFHCLNDLSPGVPVILKRDDEFVALKWWNNDEAFPMPGARALWERSSLYRLFMLRMIRLRAESDRLAASERSPEELGELYLSKIAAAARRRSIPVRSFIFPYLLPVGSYSKFQRREYDRFLRVLKTSKTAFVDLHGFFAPEDLGGLRGEPNDLIHLSPDGARRLMDHVYGLIASELKNK